MPVFFTQPVRPAARAPRVSLMNNRAFLTLTRGVFGLTSRCTVVGGEHFPRSGPPCLLAVAHVSHYDPVVVSVLSRRVIAWWARSEFYVTAGPRWFVSNAGSIEIDRHGPALPGVRNALGALALGRTVGLYPEGQLRGRDNSVLTGGTMHAGVATLARRSGLPVVPCVALGGAQFRKLPAWLPLRSGRLAMAYGTPLVATDDERRLGRAGRAAFSTRVGAAMRGLYEGLVADEPALKLPKGVGEAAVSDRAGAAAELTA